MGKVKYYAVKNGKETGVFDSWEKCKEVTEGYKDAKCKSFYSYEEAAAYLCDIDLNIDLVAKNMKEGFATLFCDGSYKEDIGNYSGAYILFTTDGKDYSQSFVGKKEEYKTYKNVAGEILAVLQGLDNAISFEQDNVRIYYDYQGIEKWATGEWQAKNDLSKFYVSKFNELKCVLNVEFEKVKGHSNNSYNDMVDKLAKDALVGQKISRKIGTNWVSINDVKENDFNDFIDLIKTLKAINVKSKKSDNMRISYEVYDIKSKCTVTYYKTTHSILLQGNSKGCCYQIVITYVNELFDDKQIEKLLSQSYSKNIDLSIVESLSQVLPNIPNNYPKYIEKLLRQSLINLKYHYTSEDYSMYAFPSLRALEGHIKYLLVQNGYHPSNLPLDCFERQQGHYRFIDKTNHKYTEKVSWVNIENCYNYFAKLRHPLFHYGTMVGEYDDTKILKTFEECAEIIMKVFEIINQTL